mgnify:CR=1 FL=1
MLEFYHGGAASPRYRDDTCPESVARRRSLPVSADRLADLLARQMPVGVAARARALLSLQAEVDRALPAALVGHVRVRALDAGVLVLACASGAAASRLRQQAESLVIALAAAGVVAVDSIKVSVDPALLAPYRPHVEKAGLPANALNDFRRLNDTVGDGPLKAALSRLLRHHR